jgi:hypothetical protein
MFLRNARAGDASREVPEPAAIIGSIGALISTNCFVVISAIRSRRRRQTETYLSSDSCLRPHCDVSPVPFDDLLGDIQPKAISKVASCTKEGLEEVSLGLLIHPVPVVSNTELHCVSVCGGI